MNFSKSRDTKSFSMVELYWHNKYFIAKVAEYKGTQEKEILDKMGFMDEKYKSLVK